MKKLLIALAAFTILLTGCQKKEAPAPKPATPESPSATQAPPASSANSVVEKVYEGVLPCADCSGIKTRIKISSKDDDATASVFEKTMTYLGKEPDNVFVAKGSYIIERGMNGDANAIIYILNPDKPKNEQDYYAIYSNDPNTLYALDHNMKKIESNLNYALKLTN